MGALALAGCALPDSWRNATFSNEAASRGESVMVGGVPLASEPAPASRGGVDARVAGEDETSGSFPLSRGALWARWNALRGDPYELDGVERRLDEGERATCDSKSMVSYRGSRLRYAGALTISEPFKERLERFEHVVAEVAFEVYGREPSRIRHYGAYSCRSTRNRSWVVSEHALGDAVDVVCFDFSPATKKQPLTCGLPGALKHSFQIRAYRGLRAGPDSRS